mgnify:CR=1 FL=1
MSEEILDAFAELFAMTTMQDGGTSEKERQFVERYFNKNVAQEAVHTYLSKYEEISAKLSPKGDEKEMAQEAQDRAFQKFAVKVLGRCRKINKSLTLDQKVLVLVKMMELVACDRRTTKRRMEVIETAAAELQLSNVYEVIRDFVVKESSEIFTYAEILTVSSGYMPNIEGMKHIQVESLDGKLVFLRIKEADMYFVKYTGTDNVKLDDFVMEQDAIYLYARGSILRTQYGDSFYYSDITNSYLSKSERQKLSFNALNLEFRFRNGTVGLRDVSVAEGAGKLIGIMGASGAGKTTLLNVMAGIEKPTQGAVLVNGIDIHEDKEDSQGIIGYVAQDDLLIEELTVYQNLYYNTKLCFKALSEQALEERVMKTLTDLGLDHIKHLKVGSVLSKTISGGQRKRLNIALELIREPVVLFLDEPTSGLSSRDSENVVDLLKELSLKGKLIFVVIHQPSSDIFKMFDKLIILDTGGYQVYYGNPVEAVVYFKKETNQAKSDEGQCFNCGNVNPEQIFDILEDQVVTEKGEYTNQRKIKPQQWNERFMKNQSESIVPVPTETEKPPKALDLPNKIKQTIVFTTRDFLSKISNRQYVLINLLQAPLLAFLLSFVIRFQNDPSGEYVYRFNDNIPAYILISVLVALFMGLTVSAEEIIKDRKIRKREAFLNLSRHSYFFSKLIILFSLSAVQTALFVLIGNSILDVDGMNLTYWLVLFSVSCFANVLGLNISSTFNSVVTVYITIPLILIPQMILSGIIFNFDKLNSAISDKGEVPLLADLMVSRWGFESIAVNQFKDNRYMAPYYIFEKEKSIAEYRRSYWLDEMKSATVRCMNYTRNLNDSTKVLLEEDLSLIKTELVREQRIDRKYQNARKIRPEFTRYQDLPVKLTTATFDKQMSEELYSYYDSLGIYYRDRFNAANRAMQVQKDQDPDLSETMNEYFNESLNDLMTGANESKKIVIYEEKLLQQMDPIYHDPHSYTFALDYRTHFLAPRKHFFGRYLDTYLFNIVVIWLMTLFLYFTLYVDAFRKIFAGLGGLNFLKKK